MYKRLSFSRLTTDDERNKNALIFFLCIGVIVILAFGNYSYAVLDGIKMFSVTILPALLPFAFVSSVMSSYYFVPKRTGKVFAKIFGIDGAFFYPFIMSLLCGYPIGAKIISDIAKDCSNQKQVKVAGILCSTPSVSFSVSVIGRILFSDILFGFIAYCICVLSSVIVAFTYSKIIKCKSTAVSTTGRFKGEKKSFYSTVEGSVLSVFTVGGIIVLFYIFAEVLLSLNVLKPIVDLLSLFTTKNCAETVCFGLLELTKGLNVLSVKSLTAVCFLCSFGGVSVILQSMAFLKKVKIKTALFLLLKIISAVLSFVLALLFSFIF